MRAILTDQAKLALKDIYKYYSKEVSENVALKVISKILDTIEDLERLPSIGSVELRLKQFNLNHKYIIAGNYKIIFRIAENIIYINDIFDGRRDPRQIEGRNG